ncbi:hypothetical protein K461DRAFT_294566 [Myriangium duriaei CBS 260.36]|uniref:MARVEL domain-containing protein n=1 Tax=Myriangium duriaei CBS 260.36 TaxID=1168546 RepID=A0A9P4MEV7_9PEZI|nr:hypothetical protein K461DRAFT_294566 [Myriangium duriaei CBS 260.36]
MQIPSYGALPLAQFFLLTRLLALISLATILGLTANFVNELVSASLSTPREILAALSITSIALLYALISIPFFLAPAHLGLLILAGLDSALGLSFIIISVVFGRPLSYLSCAALPHRSSAGQVQAWIASLAANVGRWNRLGLWAWAGAGSTVCYETKAAWGLSIALSILFTCSALVLPALFVKKRKAMPPMVKMVA